MPTNVEPQKLQRAVQTGFKRLENFRKARLQFMRAFVGQYYDKDHGRIATEPLNLIFNAIRVLVPNLVMNFPKHKVKSNVGAYRDYAELLGMALDVQGRTMKIKDTYRRWVVDAIFTMGILKTGLCESGSAIAFDEYDHIDPGEVYTETVSLDNFVIDPAARRIEEAAFVGDRIRVSRYQLLDSGLYKNDLIERLPSIGGEAEKGAGQLSMQSINPAEADEIHDSVEVVELWVPQAQAIVTVPAADMALDNYLRVADYYGPDTGSYSYLALTPPLSDNPMPVPPVGIWYDLHVMANRMAYKIMQQAERQKDVVGYRRASADDAQEVVDARDGEAVAMEDPDGVRTFSFGGQQPSNEAHIAQLQTWFNLMSGNTEALGGIRSDANTATQAEILQANGAISLEDMRDIVYSASAEEASKRAWYLHTDPLIEVPLIKRMQVPAKFTSGGVGPDGVPIQPHMLSPAELVDQQVFLTPEAQRGDFLDYQFEIQFKSLSRMDPQHQARATMEFLTKALPSVVQAAALASQVGVSLSIPKLLARVAMDQFGLEWFDEVFYDPEFQEQMNRIMLATPGPAGSQGTTQPGRSQMALQPNGQPTGLPKIASQTEQRNSDRQQGAVPGQQTVRTNQAY